MVWVSQVAFICILELLELNGCLYVLYCLVFCADAYRAGGLEVIFRLHLW